MMTTMYAEACSKNRIYWQSVDPFVDLYLCIPMVVSQQLPVQVGSE